MGRVFAELHRDHGVDLLADTGVREFRGAGGRVRGGRHRRGTRARRPTSSWSASASRPNVELAAAAGLEVDNGIVIDDALRHVGARRLRRRRRRVVASTRCYGRHVRVEHWANALNGGPAAARSMLGQDGQLRPGAVLLHRPVRPRHGVLRARRPGRHASSAAANPDDGEFIAFWLRGRPGARRA